MSASGGTKAVIAALLANVGIALTKFVAFLLTGSSSMLAEAIHSVADSGNQVLLLVGGKRSTREATPQHPFGYGRERYIYAFIVSIVLFTVGGLFALYEGVHKVQHPEAIDKWQWVPIAGAGHRDRRWSRCRSGPRSPRPTTSAAGSPGGTFIRHARAPELPVVLLEDFAALIGLVLASVRRRADADHRQRRLGRHRYARPSGRCWSPWPSCSRSRRRACCSASPPRDDARRRDHDRARRCRRRVAASSTCGRCTSVRRSCWSRRRSRWHRRSTAEQVSERSTPPRRASGRPYRSPGLFISSRTSTEAMPAPASLTPAAG